MGNVYELIDMMSGNLVGSYDTLEDALEVVREAHEDGGSTAVEELGLMRVVDDGTQQLVAANAELGHLARPVVVHLLNSPRAVTRGSRAAVQATGETVRRIEGRWHFVSGRPRKPVSPAYGR